VSTHAHRYRILTAVGVVLLLAGGLAVIIGLRAQKSAPQPPPSAARAVAVIPTPSDATSPRGPDSAHGRSTSPAAPMPSPRGPVLARSVPVRLDIPAIGVRSSVQQLGLNADGTVQVPALSRDSQAGWYRFSPTPGERGPAVILGHIDSAAYGPGVFFRLGDLRQRDTISITRADHTVAVFQVERVVEYPKSQFPTLQVYGNTDHAALRLVTCGGTFDPSKRSYEDNIVAYAALVSSHPA
jgi:Sortase domain